VCNGGITETTTSTIAQIKAALGQRIRVLVMELRKMKIPLKGKGFSEHLVNL
jgi:hypothetical protein